MRALAVVVAALACMAPACPPSPVPPEPPIVVVDAASDAMPPAPLDAAPSPVDAGSDVFAAACRNLTLLCVEAQYNDTGWCAAHMRPDQGRLADFKPACLAGAKTAADVRACGTARCTSR